MKVHLLDRHREELVTHLPMRGKAFNLDYRTFTNIRYGVTSHPTTSTRELKTRGPHNNWLHKLGAMSLKGTEKCIIIYCL